MYICCNAQSRYQENYTKQNSQKYKNYIKVESLKHVQVTLRKARGKKNKEQETGNKQKTNNKMLDLSSNTSVITLRVNGLNMPTGRQKLADWIFKKMIQLHAVNKKFTSNSMA